MSEHYTSEVNPEEIETEAELLLRFLVEINAENSDELSICFFKLKYSQPVFKKKTLKGMFGSALDPKKKKNMVQIKLLRRLEPMYLGFRSGVSEKPDHCQIF